MSLPHGLTLPQGRTLVMGVLNMTPDSFSDGGAWMEPSRALDHAWQMREAGADIVDIGGESTRPHSTRLSADQEWNRIDEAVARLADEGIVVSVDTMHAETAKRAADAGAAIINDVSGGRRDGAMNHVVASSGCAYIIQRYHALPGTPEETFDHGSDVVGTVCARLDEQVSAALEAGVAPERIIVDPGLGFSLTSEQCWEIIAGCDRLANLGYPVLIGASRKRFLATAANTDRDAATLKITEQLASRVWAVRVHDVGPHARVVRASVNEEYGRQPR